MGNADNWEEKVGNLLQSSESFKKTLISLSHNEISLDDLNKLDFKVMDDSERNRYQKVAQK